MKPLRNLKRRFNERKQPIVRFVPKRYDKKLGKIEWLVKADIVDYNLSFSRRWMAENYREGLQRSNAHIGSTVERLTIDEDGYILTRTEEK